MRISDWSSDVCSSDLLNGKTSLSKFNTRRKELDLPFQKLKQKLPENQVLRYVGELDVAKKTLEVKLISEEKSSAIGQLKGANSVFEKIGRASCRERVCKYV